MVQGSLRVVHLIPADMARGAQTYLRSLLAHLDGDHLVVTLFGAGLGRHPQDRNLALQPGRLRLAGFDPRAAYRLRRQLRELRPGVIVCHGGEGLKYAVPTRPPGVPIVYYKIGMVQPDLARPLRQQAYRALVRPVAMVAAVSEEAAEEARQVLRVPPDRVVVIPNGRDPEVYRPAATRPERPRLLSVGHLDPGKRPEVFLDVVGALRQRGLAFDAALVGDGPLLDGLREQAGRVSVDLLGRRNDVPDILASSSVLVHTSLAEGMPGVLIEAGLTGLPVVTTEVPGARSIVEDGVTGHVVGLHDQVSMVEATGRLLADPDLRARMGDRARARCLERFTMDVSASLWRSLLDDLPVAAPHSC